MFLLAGGVLRFASLLLGLAAALLLEPGRLKLFQFVAPLLQVRLLLGQRLAPMGVLLLAGCEFRLTDLLLRFATVLFCGPGLPVLFEFVAPLLQFGLLSLPFVV